jgi:DNA-binding beta-propeller fold protein YncE
MKVKQIFLLSLLAFGLFYGCDNKVTCVDCEPVVNYERGVFVVNEGPFGGTGTISWYNPDTGEVQDSIYEKANNGAKLGQFVQSLTFHNGKAYIVVNGANRVVVADAKTFKYIDTIGGLALPRFFQPINDNTAFVSQWGVDGVSGSVARIDLNTNEIVKTIPTGSGPEKMIYFKETDYLYVANSGGFGVDSTIAEIFVGQNELVNLRVIQGQRNPACMSIDYSLPFSYVPFYVLCRGDWNNPASEGWASAPFYPLAVSLPVPKGSDDLVSKSSNGHLFFTSGSAVYRIISDFSTVKLFDQPAYGLAINQTTGYLYCADAKDFNSAGQVVIRSEDGVVKGSFRTGIAPGEIVIVD